MEIEDELAREVVIVNALGLHARSAARIAKCVQARRAKIWIIKDGVKADAASILDVLSLACAQGSRVTLQIEDHSDLDILNNLTELVASGFGDLS